jgi:DNA-binding response OmpR family regulator
MKILLIEDEPELRKSILFFLHQEGYVVETAADFMTASGKAGDYEYDCVLLDITLPKGNGLDIIHQLKRNNSNAGIIIISAKNSTDDKIKGLDLGADDYLPKPFDLAELNSRIKALMRRKNFEGNTSITIHEITIIPGERMVKVHGTPLKLTAKEYDLLMFLVSNKHRVVSKNAIAEHLLGDNSDQMDNLDVVYVHLRNLRKKLTDKGCRDYIQTIYGIGYKFDSLLNDETA